MSKRLLTVSLETKYYQSSIPSRIITYMQNSIELTEDEYSDIFSSLPNFWNSENDKLIRFIYFDDESYFCEREKNVFNYTIRENETKVYKFDYASPEESKALYTFFIEKYTKIKISRAENLYDSIMKEISDVSFIKLNLLDARDKLLKESDFLLMPDYPISEEQKQKWVDYRQQLRDLTDQEAWKINDIININFPLSPKPFDQLNVLNQIVGDFSAVPKDLIEELYSSLSDKSVEHVIKNIAEISIKFDILKSISKLKIPIINLNFEEINSAEMEYNDILHQIKNDTLTGPVKLPENWWEAATSDLQEKSKEINEMLKKYKIDFTVNDILESIVEQAKYTDEEIEVNTIIDEL